MPLGQSSTATGLADYIKTLFIFGLMIVGLVALFSFIYGAFRYLVSGSSEAQKKEAKRGMWTVILGLIFLLFAALVLRTINPELLSLKEPTLSQNTETNQQTGLVEMPLLSGENPETPADLIKTYFIFGLGLLSLTALFAVAYGAFVYFLSAGYSATMKTHGRQWIIAGVSGLALILCSALILRTINPELISWQNPDLDNPSVSGQQTGLIEMPLLSGESGSPAELIKTYFTFGLIGAGLIALFAVAYGGIRYLLSGTSETGKTTGKQWIFSAVSGLALLLAAFLILYTINPALISLELPDLNKSPEQTNLSGLVEMPLVSGQSEPLPSEYIRGFFTYGLIAAGLLALFAIAYGGIRYVLSGSSETGKTTGKQWIFGAVSGLALLLAAFLILYTINPALITLQDPTLFEINIPEPPGQSILNLGERTGILPNKVTFSNPKYPNMEQRFNERAPNNLRQVVNGLPFPVAITNYDEGQHAARSDHYEGKAIDISTRYMTDEQVQTLMAHLNNNSNVSKTINGRFPNLNYFYGSPHNYDKNKPGTSAAHANHIHISVY